MKILIVSQYFWPESFLINDLAIKIKEMGHEVSVFTGKPNYPDGELFSGYTRKGIQEELYANSIPVYRIPMRPRKNGSFKNLSLNYLSFVFSGIKQGLRFSKNKQFDTILVFGLSPITAAIPAILLKWKTKAHLSIWVQDLWPESVKATGYINSRFLIFTLGFLVRGIYYFSDSILAQSQSFITQISRYTQKNKIVYYPNSVIDIFSDKPVSSTTIPQDLLDFLDNYFCVVFAGNIGTAQAVETILSAAEKVQQCPELKIVLIGSGSMSEFMQQQIKERNISNLFLAGRYPSNEMPILFSKAKGLLVTLKNDKIFNYTIPSKIQSYLAAEKPIVAALNGEGARVIEQAKAGLIGPAEDAEKLANNLIKFYHLSDSSREEMGRTGRAYFLEHFEMQAQTKRLIDLFKARMKLAEEV